jgi:hypothetical protein
MRSVGLSDLDLAARALLGLPQETWAAAAGQMIEAAHTADLWRKRHRRAHPSGGTGSLYAQASLCPRVATSPPSARYCAALLAVLQALELWRNRAHREL